MTADVSRRGFLGGAAAFFVAELTQGVGYTLEARVFNCFGKAFVLLAALWFGCPIFVGHTVFADGGLTFVSPVGEWNGRELKCDEGSAAFAKRIRNDKPVARVAADVSALGCFEFYVNGKLASVSEDGNRRDYLRPGA